MKALIKIGHFISLIAAIYCIGLAIFAFRYAGSYLAVGVCLFTAVIFSVVFWKFHLPELKRTSLVKKLKRTGVPGTGTILEATQTNKFQNLQPEFKFRIAYSNPKDNSEMVSIIRDYVEPQNYDILKPGATVPILINPRSPEQLILSK